jgi:hypothetical protein
LDWVGLAVVIESYNPGILIAGIAAIRLVALQERFNLLTPLFIQLSKAVARFTRKQRV